MGEPHDSRPNFNDEPYEPYVEEPCDEEPETDEPEEEVDEEVHYWTHESDTYHHEEGVGTYRIAAAFIVYPTTGDRQDSPPATGVRLPRMSMKFLLDRLMAADEEVLDIE